MSLVSACLTRQQGSTKRHTLWQLISTDRPIKFHGPSLSAQKINKCSTYAIRQHDINKKTHRPTSLSHQSDMRKRGTKLSSKNNKNIKKFLSSLELKVKCRSVNPGKMDRLQTINKTITSFKLPELSTRMSTLLSCLVVFEASSKQ